MASFLGLANQSAEPLAQKQVTDSNRSTSDYVTISTSEYQRLLQDAQHFTKLKDSLLSGGLSQETLDILIYGASHPPSNIGQNVKESPTAGHTASNGHSENCRGSSHRNYTHVERFNDDEEDVMTDSPSDEKGDYGESSGSNESTVPQTDQRTVMIRGLPDRVTHRDVVDAVKGGALLHVYLRAQNHIASVSFVEESAAQGFLEHAKDHGLYIAGKRVEVLWNDRQFYLPPFVRAKISNGASRNLVIHKVRPNITEALIRRDLEHIHNLIVISVKFKHGSAYISTNSVHNALFARSCMMSRFTYKGMRISFFPDECAKPLVNIPAVSKRESSVLSTNRTMVPNRFHLLSLDGIEDEESEDTHDRLSASLNGSICWTDNSVSA